MSVALVLLAAIALLSRFVVAVMLRRALGSLRERSQSRLIKTFLDDRVLERLTKIVPSLVVQLGIGLVPFLPATPALVIRNVAFALTVLHSVRAISMLLKVIAQRSEEFDAQHRSSALKSVTQLITIALYCAALIVIIATLINRSPVVVLSSLGALSAVLMLVFKDTILSFTAGILISSNDMLRSGDWIEMPQAGADGAVVDISLHTIKVQNWDNTITTIPTWKLVSESYKNWRGMSESGGRRIKRSLWIDASTVRFLTESEIQKLDDIELIRDYLVGKQEEVNSTNAARKKTLGEAASLPANQRRLTNLGTFRAYALAYLKARTDIHNGMTLMVRQMESTANGIPIEVYCFTSTTAWANYEAIQGDIFDHLIAILPDLGLRQFQTPTGADMRSMLDGFKPLPLATPNTDNKPKAPVATN
ncbi:mechanosensitive ion channel family protein [Lampropedia puyangensis]|nr:mechanosensitive ion channel domain-containing protein [Lampropedia puyangensis]